jgi:hypothetical protein
MFSDRVPRSARRVLSGEPLTLLLIGVSVLGGIGLAIACSYRPIALVGHDRRERDERRPICRAPRGERPTLPRAFLRLAAVVNAAWLWSHNVSLAKTRSPEDC